MFFVCIMKNARKETIFPANYKAVHGNIYSTKSNIIDYPIVAATQ